MSSWLNERQEEAFNLYRKFIAMSLHFREGSGFDYQVYGGNTRLSFESFVAKPMTLKRKFISLVEKLKVIDHEDYLFANIRLGRNTVDTLLESKSMEIYQEWYNKYGNGNNYTASIRSVLKDYVSDVVDRKISTTQLILEMFDTQDESLTETIIWALMAHPGFDQTLSEYAKDNIFHELNFKKILKIKSIYLYFNIL